MTATYEIRPCVETDEGEVYQCPERDAELWTVYRRGEDGLALAVCDFFHKADAELFIGLAELAWRATHANFKYGAHQRLIKQAATKVQAKIEERIAA